MTININIDTTNVYSISIPDPNSFLFDEKVYASALHLVEGIERIWSHIKKEVAESNLQLSEDGKNIDGDFMLLSDSINSPYAAGLMFGAVGLRNKVNAQYAPPDKTLGHKAAIVLSTRTNDFSGKLKRNTKWYLLHEFIHHIDTVDRRPFTEGTLWDEGASRFEQYFIYFNTPHEQRAYFYTAVYSMTQGVLYRAAKKLGLLKHRAIFDLFVAGDNYFARFNEESLTPENRIHHQNRMDDLFVKLQMIG